MKNTLTHEQVAAVSLKIRDEKAEIERRLAKGVTLIDMAARYKLAVTSFKRIARAVGVQLPDHGNGTSGIKVLHRDILTVLARACREGGVNHDEIKPYLDEAPEGRRE